MMVTDEQLLTIQHYLLSEGVVNVSLQEDLVDHYCCYIEPKLDEGTPFDQAFHEAKCAIAPEGAQEIQSDLDYLLTIKKKIMLRKVVFVCGFLGALNIMLALALRVAGIVEPELTGLIAMSGILTLAVSVLPYSFFKMYQRSVQRLSQA